MTNMLRLAITLAFAASSVFTDGCGVVSFSEPVNQLTYVNQTFDIKDLLAYENDDLLDVDNVSVSDILHKIVDISFTNEFEIDATYFAANREDSDSICLVCKDGRVETWERNSGSEALSLPLNVNFLSDKFLDDIQSVADTCTGEVKQTVDGQYVLLLSNENAQRFYIAIVSDIPYSVVEPTQVAICCDENGVLSQIAIKSVRSIKANGRGPLVRIEFVK